MPGFITHYLFGSTTYPQITHNTTRNLIAQSRGAYGLGLQGPDIFFYFLPSYLIHKKNLGSITHDYDTNLFFRNLIGSLTLFSNPKYKKIAQAYILGFLGHYCLDLTCHPYVYARTNYTHPSQSYSSRHMTLETDIDKELLSYYKNLLPSQFIKTDTIRLSQKELHVISLMLNYAFSHTYHHLFCSYQMIHSAISSMRLGLNLLKDTSGKKKVWVRNIEKYITGYAAISPMIPSNSLTYYTDCCNLRKRTWSNPWDTSIQRNSSMYELIETARTLYLEILEKAGCFFQNMEHNDDNALLETLLATIGNHSYHSGLPAGKWTNL
ncbi:MAG: zinc dependent phospholipase C family protein [Lachnospiraceae bacterium]